MGFRTFVLVHFDVWSSSRVVSKLGFEYFVIFVDDFFIVTRFYLIKDRLEVYSIFGAFVTKIKNNLVYLYVYFAVIMRKNIFSLILILL